MSKDIRFYIGGQRGSGLSYSSIILAEKISEELAKRLGGEPKDYVMIDDAFVEEKPKKFIWQSMQCPMWRVINQTGKKNE